MLTVMQYFDHIFSIHSSIDLEFSQITNMIWQPDSEQDYVLPGNRHYLHV